MNDPAMPPNRCPACGATLSPGAAHGLCARCLLAGAAEPTESPSGVRPADPPELVQVGAAFPQLEVIELIGAGGMGAVFRARQPKLNRLVALKVLPASLAERDPAFAERFEREGQMLARLHHPNIVAVYDSGRAGDFFYLLMEHVDGVNLRQAMRASRFTPAQALGIVPRICDALQYAHDEGVLHRDIKPENILLDAKGRVKLADFGIAKLIGDGAPESPNAIHAPHPAHLTQAGAALGTPSYMAPEQRETPSDVDHRADIYSLGVVFYELLTGELPVGEFALPSELSASDPRIDAIVRQALERERERRQYSAGEVKTQVENIGAAPASEAPAPGRLATALTVVWWFTALTAGTFLLAAFSARNAVVPMFVVMLVATPFLAVLARRKAVKWATPDGRVWLKSFAFLGWILALPFVGLSLFAAQSALSERGGWNPAADEALAFPLAFLGAIFLPLAATTLWQASPSDEIRERRRAPLTPTLLLHAVIFALLSACVLFVLPRHVGMFQDFGTAMPGLMRQAVNVSRVFGPALFPLLFLLDAGACYLARDLGGKRGLRWWSACVIAACALLFGGGYLSWGFRLQKIATEFQRPAANPQAIESWSYTPRHWTSEKVTAWSRSANGVNAGWNPATSFRHGAGVITLTGPRESVGRLATLLRAADRPETKSWTDLPMLNMPPEFFTRCMLPGLMSQTSYDTAPFTKELVERLQREGVVATQFARAMSDHVLEFEKAMFVNHGTPFESITRSPGASVFYDATLPCADQPEKPLTFRIERTTQQLGTQSKFADFAPWFVEEAKTKSKEPLIAPSAASTPPPAHE